MIKLNNMYYKIGDSKINSFLNFLKLKFLPFILNNSIIFDLFNNINLFLLV